MACLSSFLMTICVSTHCFRSVCFCTKSHRSLPTPKPHLVSHSITLSTPQPRLIAAERFSFKECKLTTTRLCTRHPRTIYTCPSFGQAGSCFEAFGAPFPYFLACTSPLPVGYTLTSITAFAHKVHRLDMVRS